MPRGTRGRGGRSRVTLRCERPPQPRLLLRLRPIGLALRRLGIPSFVRRGLNQIKFKPPDHVRILILALTLFLSAFLLFMCQPMVGKMLLPYFGGAASVWT